jgi:hypothetical protein
MSITLESYQHAERKRALEESRRGFFIHAAITVVVLIGLIVLNVTVASEFPWAIFPVVGMSIGLFMHWYFGVARGEEMMRRHQREIEQRAAA